MTQKQEIFTLMGGRVKMRRGRYNPTSDAVWLAAYAAGRGARDILDVGVGTGGVTLCLMSHDANINVTAIDISPEMLAEFADNAALNGHDPEIINADINAFRTDRRFDLVVTNPPYFQGTPAAHNAHHNADLGQWTRRCLARVRPRGTFAIIVDAGQLATVMMEMAAKCGDIEIMPLFGAKRIAERVMLRGRLGTRGPTILHRGLSMNDDRVLRGGLTIDSVLATLG